MTDFKGDAKKLIERGNQLFGKRTGLESLWQEIALNFYVERANFTAMLAVGEEFAAHLNSSYPLIVRRELGNAFSAMLRPRDEDWFAISIEREDRLDRAGREWLEWASGVQRRAMYDRKAMFARATKEGDHDFAAFGQAVISREINWKEQALLYRNWHLKDVAWNERETGEIGEVHRKWKPQVGYLKGRFQNVHPKVTQCAAKDSFKEIDCRHIVMPSEEYEGTWRTPYVSVYLDADNSHIMEEVGSWSPIYTIPRWQTVSGSQYAYSPATVAGLPDGRLLQAMTLTLLEAGEMAVRPPMVAVREAIRSDIQLFSGGITSVDAEYDERLGEALRPLVQDKSGLPFGLEIGRDTREMLAACFYLNKLTLPPADREMTAYETGQRIQEYIRSALPLFEPMETDYNGSLCEGTFEDLLRVGAFSGREMPRSLSGQKVRFTFKSPLHDAIERKKGTKFMEAKSLIREAIEIDPSTLPTLDARKSLRDALTGIGTPAAWLRDEEVVEQFAAEQEAQQQAQTMMQAAGGAAAVVEQAGKAKQSLDAAA
jgi:hypothetical protein